MAEMADDILDGFCCEICGEYFINDDGELEPTGCPTTCEGCSNG